MTRDSIIITYDNSFHGNSCSLKTVLGIWCRGNMNNLWLSRNRKEYPTLNIKRRKVSDIVDSDELEVKMIKEELLLKNSELINIPLTRSLKLKQLLKK